MELVSISPWNDFKVSLEKDVHPGAIFLNWHFDEIQDAVVSHATGQILVVRDKLGQAVAWTGITHQCGAVDLHFMYIVPEYRNTAVLLQLMQKITNLCREQHYCYVSMRCPEIDELRYLHDLFLEISVNKLVMSMTTDATMVIYLVPKDLWEQFFAAA